MGMQEVSRGDECNWDRQNVGDDGKIDGTCHGSKENKCAVKTNVLRRDRGPGGLLGVQEVLGRIKSDPSHEINGKMMPE